MADNSEELHAPYNFVGFGNKVIVRYDDVKSLRLEARQKLKQFQPVSVGQASRISGVSPADISVLLVYLEHFHAANAAHNE